MQKTRRTAWLLATGLALVVATTGLPPATATATSTAGPDQAALTGGGRVVTLLTGDRVRVVGEARVVEPGQGRERMVFHTYRADGHDYVVPADAVGLVGSGRLDRRLFDVTALLEFGYDDAARADLPLIVKHRPGVSAAGLSASGARVTGQLPSIAAAAVRAPKGEAGRLWPALVGDGVEAVWLDGQRKVVLDHSVPQIGAPAAWQAGFTGRGVTVGVLDTGIDAAHPDFAGRIAEVRNFTDTPDGGDVIGHGTHVTSIMAGSGAAAGGRYRGVAPEATLLVGKVCTVESCPESALLAGMEWAAAAGARVVNLSIGGADYPGLDPLEEAVNTLTDRHGTLFAIAAGNMGWNGPGTVASPGSAHAALTVGAVDKQDQLADFSGRGPRVGDGAIKPDITAPGVDIVAALASGVPAEPVDGAYTRNSGTSMATPHAAGAAALLAQQHPEWRAGELKAALMGAAQAAAALTPFEQGAGRLDVARAVTHSVIAQPASLSLGLQRWPHDDDQPITTAVTYRNHGSAPVTLSLTLQVKGPDGAQAPAGMFTVQPGQLTVPPGGTAQASVTADTRQPGPEGQFTGALVATADGHQIRTPLAVDREPESYDLTLTHLDRTGAPAVDYETYLWRTDGATSTPVYEPDGTATVRLRKGSYHVHSGIFTPNGEDWPTASMLVQPLVELTADTAITLDARQARPSAVTVPRPGARVSGLELGYFRSFDDGRRGNGALIGSSFDGLYSAHLGPPVAEVTGRVINWWVERGPAGDWGNGAHVYNLAWDLPGQVPSGFERHVRDPDLAVVHAEYRAQVPGSTVFMVTGPTWSDYFHGRGGLFTVPATRTEYYLAGGMQWTGALAADDNSTEIWTSRTSYQPGRRYMERWHVAPFGPSFAGVRRVPHVGRSGDRIGVRTPLPLFTDQALNHYGRSVTESERTVLYRDGQPVDDVSGRGDYDVPPEPADYRLEAEATRGAPFTLSTRVSCVWTFRSGHVPGDQPAALPLMLVRFTPDLDADNAAPAGRPFLFPAHVQRQNGDPGAAVRRLAVEASYDDGVTWRPARTVKTGDRWLVLVDHPARAGFVSLRASATDSAGHTIQQTIIRAYGLRG